MSARQREAGAREASAAHAQLRGARTVLWTLLLACGAFIAWAAWAEIDEVTRAPGAVIAGSRTQIIQSQEGGILRELAVREGDVVKPGQLLASLERDRAEAAWLEARAKAAGLAANVARLRAEVFGGDARFPPALAGYPEFRDSQLALLRKRRMAVEQEAAALESMISLVQQELDLNLPLLASGDVSRTEILRLQRQLADLRAQVTNKRNKYFQDAQSDLNKAQEELAGVEQALSQRKTTLDHTELRTPVRGVVKNIRVTTLGGVIRPGEEVMQIVPLEDDLVIEAKVASADIAFLKPGMETRVKIDAYDYTLYGDLQGELVFISADTLSEDLKQGEQPYYRVRVRTSARAFKGPPGTRYEILPGMTAVIEIHTRKRTVLQYLTRPITKTLAESLGER
jgi:adhesin transport system membrane fusion protein